MTGPEAPSRRPMLAHLIRVFAAPIILGWVVLTVLVNVAVPQLEVVGEAHSAPMAPMDAPSMQAMLRLGRNFAEFDSNSTVMIVVEGSGEHAKLGDAAHRYYDAIIARLSKDHEHIQHIQDFWSDRLTAAGVQSADGEAAYVMINIAGNQGETLANDSVDAVRRAVEETTAPPGVRGYVTGPAALSDDMHLIGNASLATITLFTLGAIALMLLLVYRSIVTTALQLFMTFVALSAARGTVAVLGNANAFGLTTFAANILTMLAIAAATDYGIFLIGRYQEAHRDGEDRESAYYTMFHSVAPVVLGSGLTIAGATYCLSLARLPWFSTMGAPVAIGMLVVVAAGLTLGPAVVTVAGRFGAFEAKRPAKSALWRKAGTAVVRWPLPVFIASGAVVLIGVVALPGYSTSYNDRHYLPDSAPANIGYAAADRHFSEGRMNPDMLMVEADHDMRNPADLLVLDKVARNVIRTDGIAMIQDITRPLGIPIQHSSIPFATSLQSQSLMQNMDYLKERMADIITISDNLGVTIDYLQQTLDLQTRLSNATHRTNSDTHELTEITDDLRDHIANFIDFWLPIRNYFYWEPHCFDIPGCWSLRSIWDSLDGIDQLDEKFHDLADNFDDLDLVTHQLLTVLPPQIESLKQTRALTLTLHSTFTAMLNQLEAMSITGIAMGQSFDAARNDDLFYLPPEAFDNPDFQIGLRQFMSPDGRSARFFITHEGDPMSPAGIERVAPVRKAAQQALKQSSLSGAKVYLGGTAATFKDMHDGARYDLMIAVVSALTLIFAIMLLITRSLVAAAVIVGTAGSSIAAAFGLSVLIWQDLLGIPIQWVVMLLSIIILLAVGSDYNLLLVSRFKEEIHAGLKTGYIRAMGGSGGVVTAAGLVFAFTMGAMLGSELRVLGQFGSTVCIGLLMDTLVVRALLMPSVAVMLGRWFWWPRVIHPRGDNARRPAGAG